MSTILMEIKATGTKLWLSVFGVAIKSRWDARYENKIIINQSTQYPS